MADNKLFKYKGKLRDSSISEDFDLYEAEFLLPTDGTPTMEGRALRLSVKVTGEYGVDIDLSIIVPGFGKEKLIGTITTVDLEKVADLLYPSARSVKKIIVEPT